MSLTFRCISETTRFKHLGNFFSDRVVNVWHALPAADVDFTSLAWFRRSILKVDMSDFVKQFNLHILS